MLVSQKMCQVPDMVTVNHLALGQAARPLTARNCYGGWDVHMGASSSFSFFLGGGTPLVKGTKKKRFEGSPKEKNTPPPISAACRLGSCRLVACLHHADTPT